MYLSDKISLFILFNQCCQKLEVDFERGIFHGTSAQENRRRVFSPDFAFVINIKSLQSPQGLKMACFFTAIEKRDFCNFTPQRSISFRDSADLRTMMYHRKRYQSRASDINIPRVEEFTTSVLVFIPPVQELQRSAVSRAC